MGVVEAEERKNLVVASEMVLKDKILEEIEKSPEKCLKKITCCGRGNARELYKKFMEI